MPFPPKDGESLAILNSTELMLSANWNLSVLAMNTNKHPGSIDGFHSAYPQLKITQVELDTRIKKGEALLNLLGRQSYILQRFLSEKFSLELIKILKSQNFDLIQLEGHFLLLYLDLIKRYSKAPILLRSHNLEFEIWERMADKTKGIVKRLYLKSQAKRLKRFELDYCAQVDAVCCISDKDQLWFERNFPQIPNLHLPFLLKSKFENSSAPVKGKAYFLGSLDWLPNIEALDFIVESLWPKLLTAFPDLELHIAGRNPGKEAEAWKGKGLKVIGEIEDSESFILQMGFMLLPLSAGSGMRIKILEALALGRPVLCSPLAAEGVKLDLAGLHICETVEDYIQAIRLIHSPDYVQAQMIKEKIHNYYGMEVRAKDFFRFVEQIPAN